MIVRQGKRYYPLEFAEMRRNDKVYYIRSARQANYFYLDFRTGVQVFTDFIPRESSGFVTADGDRLRVANAV